MPPKLTWTPELTRALSDADRLIGKLAGEWIRLPNPLVQAGMVHSEFEAIHPFLDGNGRVGRLLIVLFLIELTLKKASRQLTGGGKDYHDFSRRLKVSRLS